MTLKWMKERNAEKKTVKSRDGEIKEERETYKAGVTKKVKFSWHLVSLHVGVM